MDYDPQKGWHDGKVIPYAPLELDPAASVFHYGQEMFEGLKAYKTKDGKVQLFRPDMNAKRTNNTNKRICIPEMDEDLYVEAVKTLVSVDKDWIPSKENTALYIRPFIIATQPFLGVAASDTYKFVIILSPVGPYYENGLAPTKIYVEDEFIRSAMGGTGFAKIRRKLCGRSDCREKGSRYGLRSGSMAGRPRQEICRGNRNLQRILQIDGEIYLLPRREQFFRESQRDSMIEVMKEWGYKVNETRFTIDDVFKAAKREDLKKSSLRELLR